MAEMWNYEHMGCKDMLHTGHGVSSLGTIWTVAAEIKYRLIVGCTDRALT